MIRCINEEHLRKKIDFVIFNGDSVDGGSGGTSGNLELFLPIAQTLKMPFFMIGGNHDCITAPQWDSKFDYDYNYIIKYGNYGFICVNPFEDTTDAGPPIMNTINADWLSAKLSVFTNEKLFLVAHDILNDNNLINSFKAKENAKCSFVGHAHNYFSTALPNGLPSHRCGHFSGYWVKPGENEGWCFRNLEFRSGKLITSVIFAPWQYSDHTQLREEINIVEL